MRVSLATLLDDHDRIEDAIAALRLAVDTAATDTAVIIGLRTDLAEVIDAHVAREDGVIYPEVKLADGPLSPAARGFSADFDVLRGEWNRYLGEWPGTRVTDDPAGFAGATHAMMARLSDRLARENECLYPRALREGALPLR